MEKIKIGNKEYTQDELNGLLGVAAKAQEKIKKLEEEKKQFDDYEEIKKVNEQLLADKYKKTLDSRISDVNKWLAGRDDSDALMEKIGNMSDDDFNVFKEGKTNDSLDIKEQLELLKQQNQDLETQKTDLEKAKEQALKDNKDKLNKSNPPVPTTEINVGDGVMDDGTQEMNIDTKKILEDVYYVNRVGKKYFDDKPYAYAKADAYLKMSEDDLEL